MNVVSHWHTLSNHNHHTLLTQKRQAVLLQYPGTDMHHLAIKHTKLEHAEATLTTDDGQAAVKDAERKQTTACAKQAQELSL